MSLTRIEWTDRSWNPITGCTPVGEGCRNCYARAMAHRLAHNLDVPHRERYAGFRPTFWPERLGDPLIWRKPQRVFVGSMTDLFHPDIPDRWRDEIWATMGLCEAPNLRHLTWQILTKRPDRALAYARSRAARGMVFDLPNLHLGASIWDQPSAARLIPDLLATPAALHFVSYEPALGGVDFRPWLPGRMNRWPHRELNPTCAGLPKLGGVICGAETGPRARPMDLDWARRVRDDCRDAGLPFFFKRGPDGSRLLDGREWNELP